ncbi:8487_t:CDS:2, partial [Gigaspora rosea]
MDDNDLLVSLVENMVKIVVEVVRNLKIRQAKHRYRPQLYYVYRHQGHLAHSCSDQAKRECQEQMMNVRFMKIIDPKVGNYESRRRIGKGKREIISNGTVRNKVTQMKNRAIPVKSIVIEESGDCRDKVVENEPVVVMEASLDEVIKIDAMMKGLLKTLMTNASDVKWSDDKKNMMVSSIIRDEIYMNDVIINDAPELNSKVQLIEYVDETSNVEDVSEFDLEMKMDGDASINQTSDGGETTGIEIEAPKDKGST